MLFAEKVLSLQQIGDDGVRVVLLQRRGGSVHYQALVSLKLQWERKNLVP